MPPSLPEWRDGGEALVLGQKAALQHPSLLLPSAYFDLSGASPAYGIVAELPECLEPWDERAGTPAVERSLVSSGRFAPESVDIVS